MVIRICCKAKDLPKILKEIEPALQDGLNQVKEVIMAKDIRDIKAEIGQAEQNFDYADKEHIDAAIYELKATEEKVSAVFREERK